MLTKEKKLRVGIIVEDGYVPFWVDEIAEKVGAIPLVNIEKYILTNVRKTEAGFAFKLFASIDHLLLPGNPSAHLRMNTKLAPDTITLNLNSSEEIDESDLNKLRASDLDILFHFGESILNDSILSTPKFGTWTLFFGNSKLPLAYAGFQEWFSKDAVTQVRIVKLNEQGNFVKVISESITKTDLLSLSRNQTSIFSKAIDLILTTLKQLTINDNLDKSIMEESVSVQKKPDLLIIALAFCKLLFRLVNKTFNKIFFIDQWILLTDQSKNFKSFDLKKFSPIIPPKDRFWADPFVISYGNKYFVFMEELLYKTKKGHLTCLVLDRSGKIEASKTIIEQPYHLSYPHVFKYKGNWYLIPESAENKTVDLYECVEFPFQWKFKRTLLEGLRAYDSTLYFDENRSWLFCTIQYSEAGSPNDELHLFSMDDLLTGTPTPHAMNPIVSNPYNARPAGRIFFHEGNWYRPSQVCVPRYGYALSFNRIDELNENVYKETMIAQYFPEEHRYLKSMHTFNSDGELTIIDGQVRRFRF